MSGRNYTAYHDDDFELSPEHDEYIRMLVQKNFPRYLFSEDEVDLEIDELIQVMRIRFWMASRKYCIRNYKAFIGLMVRRGIIDITRRHRNLSLFLDEFGEPRQGIILMAAEEGMRDPAYEYEQKEHMIEQTEHITRIALIILTLPPVQRRAIIYLLKDISDEVWPLVKVLKAHNIDIEAMDWPEDKIDVSKVRASLYYARKKLRNLLKSMLDE
jgi:DNA-directed RNA polymerase specialized sigma24 family protein